MMKCKKECKMKTCWGGRCFLVFSTCSNSEQGVILLLVTYSAMYPPKLKSQPLIFGFYFCFRVKLYESKNLHFFLPIVNRARILFRVDDSLSVCLSVCLSLSLSLSHTHIAIIRDSRVGYNSSYFDLYLKFRHGQFSF